MGYTMQEAADAIGVSYATAYSIAREHSLGGVGQKRILSTVDLECIREQMYYRRRRRSKTYRLEERMEALEAKIAGLELIYEGVEI